jgi:translation initiation factor 1
VPERGRCVYSTGLGRVCPACGEPERSCRCGEVEAPAPVAGRLTARLRLEKQGRGGKEVTVVHGLPRNPSFLRRLATDLKRELGTGGKATDDGVELQGDHRERLRPLLAARGHAVKG